MKKNISKKIIPLICFLFILSAFIPVHFSMADIVCPPGTVMGSAGNSCVQSGYKLLAPLPCPPGSTDCIPGQKLESVDPAKGLGSYLNLMIKIFIGICAVLSVVMIVIGGLEVMTSELAHTKEDGKHKIAGALLGLLIALGAYALLYTINPDLLKSDVKIPDTKVATPNSNTSALGICEFKENGEPSSLTKTQADCDVFINESPSTRTKVNWTVNAFQGSGAGGTW